MKKFKAILCSLLTVMLLAGIVPTEVFAKAVVQLQPLFVDQQYSYVDLYGLSNSGYAKFQQDNKYGYLDGSGQVAIQPQYEVANDFYEGLAAVKQDGLYGFINTAGEMVIPPQYTSVQYFINGFARVGKKVNDKVVYGYINTNGEEVIPINYNNISNSLINGYAVAANSTTLYLINISGATMQFEGKSIGVVDSKYVRILNDKDEYTYYDLNGNKLNFNGSKTAFLANDLMSVAQDGKYGYINSNGDTVIPFDFFSAYSFDSNGLALVAKEKQNFYTIDKTGNTVIKPDNYTNIRPFISYSNPDNLNYYIVTKLDGNNKSKQGVADKNGNIVIPAIYDMVAINEGFSNGLLSVKTNNKYGFVDKNGNFVIPAVYDAIGRNNNGIIAAKKDNKWGFINEQGNTVIPFEYDEVAREGVNNSLVSVKKDGKCGAIDIAGNVVIPFEYDRVQDIYVSPDGYVWTVKDEDTTDRNRTYSLYSVKKIAEPTQSSVLIDGQKVPLEAYNIDGSNYFKLRDIAKVLSGTKKQFAIGWDNSANSITITTGTAYTTVGGELAVTGNTDNLPASITNSKVLLNGKQLKLTAYNINGSNYFKLRDLASSLDFGLSWDESANTISVNTASGYTK